MRPFMLDMITNSDIKLKYFIYCRRSSEDQEDKQVLSIEAQLRELNEYAKRCNFNVVNIFTESKSAHKPGREIFNDMITRIEIGEASALLVWQVNRIARNAKDGGNFIQLMDDGFIKQVDTPHKQYRHNGDDLFFMNLEFGMAKKYSDDLSDNVKRGIRQKYELGQYPNLAPIGYINSKVNGVINIYPDPEHKGLVIKIFVEYATGKYSLGGMVDRVFEWGLRTRRNKPISKSHLHRILQNPLYYGCFEHGGELHNGSYEALITKKLFDEVQAALHNKAKPKKIENDWPYAALLKCGCGCGASVIFETKRKFYKKKGRWAEYTYARSSKRCSKCVQKGIDLAELERQLDEKIAPVTIDEKTWSLGIKMLNAKYEAEAKQRAQVVESRQRQYQRLQSELDGYFKMRAKDEMTSEEFSAKKKAIFDEQTRLKEKIDDGLNGQRTWLELAEEFFTMAYQAREMLNSDDLEAKRKAVEKIGWNVLLKDEKLVWAYQKPYDILLKPQYRSDLRRREDSNL